MWFCRISVTFENVSNHKTSSKISLIILVYLRSPPRLLEIIGAILIMFGGLLIPVVKAAKRILRSYNDYGTIENQPNNQ